MQSTISRRSAIALASSVALAPLVGCGEPGAKGPSADEAFTALAAKWLDGYAKTRPAGATALGDHRFDGEIDDVSYGRARGQDDAGEGNQGRSGGDGSNEAVA